MYNYAKIQFFCTLHKYLCKKNNVPFVFFLIHICGVSFVNGNYMEHKQGARCRVPCFILILYQF